MVGDTRRVSFIFIKYNNYFSLGGNLICEVLVQALLDYATIMKNRNPAFRYRNVYLHFDNYVVNKNATIWMLGGALAISGT